MLSTAFAESGVEYFLLGFCLWGRLKSKMYSEPLRDRDDLLKLVALMLIRRFYKTAVTRAGLLTTLALKVALSPTFFKGFTEGDNVTFKLTLI